MSNLKKLFLFTQFLLQALCDLRILIADETLDMGAPVVSLDHVDENNLKNEYLVATTAGLRKVTYNPAGTPSKLTQTAVLSFVGFESGFDESKVTTVALVNGGNVAISLYIVENYDTFYKSDINLNTNTLTRTDYETVISTVCNSNSRYSADVNI
jgi:hypothetical protein